MTVAVLVFGVGGQVARALSELVATRPDGSRFYFTGRDRVNIADRRAVRDAIAGMRPGIVINAAAYTHVDLAETESDVAFACNRDGPAHMAESCAEIGSSLIHISTDYVFDGRKTGPYAEADPINPLGVYAASKAAGETAVRDRLDAHVILRTAWVFSPFGRNFVKTVLRLSVERKELRIVNDQWGAPTGARDVARALISIADSVGTRRSHAWGTFHYCGAPAITWYGFASAILDTARLWQPRLPRLTPITTAEYPTPAQRPANSVLDSRRIAACYGIVQPDWRLELNSTVGQLLGTDTGGGEH